MSSGRVHTTATVVSTPLIGLVSLVIIQDPRSSLITCLGCLSGIFLTPDLDQITISFSEWKIIRWTFGLGYFWLAFWGPYATFIPHRHVFSHGPVISTLGRVLYIYAMISLYQGIGFFPEVSLPSLGDLFFLWEVQDFLLGLLVSDIVHWVFDNQGKIRRALKF